MSLSISHMAKVRCGGSYNGKGSKGVSIRIKCAGNFGCNFR